MFFGKLYDVIIQSTRQYFGSQYFLDSRPEYAFVEPLIEFLMFVVQKLGQKTTNW